MLSKKDKTGLWIIFGIVAVLVGFLFIQVTVGSKMKAGSDNCVGEVTANTVLLLDYSEAVSDQTLDEIVSRAMTHVRNKVKVNEKVSIFTISNLSKNSLKPIVSLCKPPEDGNRAIENIQTIRKHFQREFETPLREALSQRPTESIESPIAQALTDISLSQYLHGNSNSLLIFSDMLENTSKFSIYSCKSADTVVSKYKESRRGGMERPEFLNTEVHLNLIPRLEQTNETLKCRDRLWTWFFGAAKGERAMVKIEYLPGGSGPASRINGNKK